MTSQRFFRKNDVILAVGALLCAAALFLFTQNRGESAGRADVYRNGEIVHTFRLDRDEAWTWREGDDFVSVEASLLGVRIVESSCPDQVCVRQGLVKNGGRSIICLPNKVVVQLIPSEDQSQDIDAVLY